MEITNWISAICAILALPISIWSIISSSNNAKEITKIKQTLTVINKTSHGNIVNVGSANNNGRDAVHFE